MSTHVETEFDIGDVIRKLRKAKRMNQTDFGKKVGVNKATIVRVEQSDLKVSREIYKASAAVLGLTLAELERRAAHLQETQRPEPQVTPKTGTAGSDRSGSRFPDSGKQPKGPRRR